MICEPCDSAWCMIRDIPRLEYQYGERPYGFQGERLRDRFEKVAAELHAACEDNGCECEH